MTSVLPIIGSQLLATIPAAPNTTRFLSVPTGCSTIDEVLQDGFQYGEITSLSGPEQTGKSLIAVNTVATHLLLNKEADVGVIDTTGSFSPLLLRDVLRERSWAQSHASESYIKPGYSNEQIAPLLNRVKILRAFDLEGVKESIEEVFELWCRNLSFPHIAVIKPEVREIEIKSSQDEEDEIALEETTTGHGEDAKISITDTSPKMIIIDQLSNVVSRELGKDQVQGEFCIIIRSP